MRRPQSPPEPTRGSRAYEAPDGSTRYSGPNITDAQRTTEKATLRFRAGYRAKLERLANKAGLTMAGWIEARIDEQK